MSPRIAVEIDVYGKYARLSAVADWVEKLAADGNPLTEAGLADYVGDIGWRFPDHWVVSDKDETGEDETEDAKDVDRGRVYARSVFALLEERAATLGARYPFAITNSQLVLMPGTDLLESPYVALWALTMCHAYSLAIADKAKATEVFEETVANVLRSDRMLAVNFGQVRRDAGDFSLALLAAGQALNLPVDPEAAVKSKYAQDENVDMICHIPWGDTRPGLWGYVGQVTCARSDDWQGKMLEPSTAAWMNWLGTTVKPIAFLAVPHHVEPKHMARLVEHGERIIIDRLRICWVKSGVTEREQVVIEAVKDAECDAP